MDNVSRKMADDKREEADSRRQIADDNRDAADLKRESVDAQVIEVLENNPHLISSGARHEINKIKLGYVVLAIGTIIGIWAFNNLAQNNLKRQINSLSASGCVSSIQIYTKYNDLVDSVIQTRKQSLAEAKRLNNPHMIKINKSAIERYKKDKIVPPTPQICRKPVIK